MESTTLLTSIILFTNVTLLSILVPGGPIENRDFKNLKGSIFWGFNIFLVTLGITSLIISYFILFQEKWSFQVSFLLGVLYLLVYALDLSKVFPKSNTKMSNTLMLIEIINSMLAILLIILSFFSINMYY
ncbi:MAG: hypothetical protein ACLFQ4_00010 [Halanaerobium sp.]